MTFLYILLFIVCLSTLVMIHELGHLATAKMFKVYCFEYSIGFGPKLFSKKRKNGETYFSLRAIPFGGFVSMYGESETVPEGLEIDPSRSLLNIKKWKRAIIMLAGIVMNFLLAIVLFLVYEGCFPKYQAHYAHVTINSESIATQVGLRSDDFVYAERYADTDRSLLFYDDNATLIYENNSTHPVYFGLDYSTLTLKDTSLLNHSVAYDKVTIDTLTDGYEEMTITQIINDEFEENKEYLVTGFINVYVITESETTFYLVASQNFSEDATNDKSVVFAFNMGSFDMKELGSVPLGQEVSVIGKISKNKENDFYQVSDINKAKFSYPNVDNGNWLAKKRSGLAPTKISFSSYVVDEACPLGRGNKTISFNEIALTAKDDAYRLPENIGINLQLTKYRNGFGDTFKCAFQDFANAGSLIYRSLGSLFTDKNAWKDVGGIIAIGVVTTRTLQEYGFGTFLMYWAVISVNLAIVNLLPFPGLDGWHFLVIIVEAISHKEIPAKVKNWFSLVGLILLFALMILIVVKDIITYV